MVYPYSLGNPQTVLATEAAWCAQDQGRYFDYQHVLFENQGKMAYAESNLVNLAAEVGLDQAAFSQCLSSGQHRQDVENARRVAFNQGINATPTFLVGDQRIEGNQPYEVFQRVINQELAQAQ